MKRWDRFLSQVEADIRLWLFLCAYFSLFRAIFVGIFQDQIAATSGFGDVVSVLLYGLRYDVIVASYAVAVPVLGSLAAALCGATWLADRLRSASATLALVLAALLCVVAVGYFREYGETFNERLFGLLYDDRAAIAATVWKGYHPIPNLVAVCTLALLSRHALQRWLAARPRLAPALAARSARPWARVLVSALLAIGLAAGLRGSLGRRPAQLKDAAITGDPFLDQTVLNPVTALRYAIQQEARLASASGLDAFLPDRDVGAAARRWLGVDAQHGDLDRYLARSAGGPAAVPPRHIVVIVGEGLSAWPLAPPYDVLGLGDDLSNLARDGIHVRRFLPAAYGTIESLGAIMTGLPDAELRTNYQATARSPYPTSIAPIFHRLGYRTRFFYGGFLSWQRVGDFARDQGFDEVYGGGQMGSWVSSNEWGVDDEDLLRFVRATVPDDVPSFTLIMTTSLHPPYDVDVAAKGFVSPAVPDALAPWLQRIPGSGFPGHYWYSSRCIAEFVRASSASLTHALFVVTGDHPSRDDVRTQPSLFDLRAVPLILYGPEILRDQKLPDGASGSHLDIAPTLIELAAPGGFSYHAVGRTLFAADGHPVGIGQHVVIGSEYLLDLRRGQRVETLGAATEAPPPELLESWRALHDALHGMAWWRIKHGPELPREDG